ncbi:MAG TPA: ABATE domain-containing protein [Terriglobales bacterium]|nr:ABATE domain-containing protein [Terriglobales bacterium]
MPELRSNSQFQFTAGNLSLDFTNTLDNRGAENEIDLLANYADLLAWGVAARTLSRSDAERLLGLAEKNPVQARAALRRALQLRESMYTIFSAIAERRIVPGSSLSLLNAEVQQAGEHARIVSVNRSFSWEWIAPEANLASPLWPIARDAAELLTEGPLELVRTCAAETCGWLFLDTTKNHRRRWCDMKTCGNRNKARRYYQRAQR